MEFQAIVMAAGRGSHLADISSNFTKTLLPIANRPMIWYPINMLEKAGFQDVMVVVSESELQQVQDALISLEVSINCDYIPVPDETEDDGTADSLRLLAPRIKRDMLIVSCDVITDMALHLVADVHRTNDATVTMVLAPALDTSDVSVPGSKANKMLEKELIGLDEKESRVMFIASEVDLDKNISFRKSTFKKHPYMTIRNRLIDSHMYLMNRSVLDILDKNRSISTIKGQLIPYLVKQQFCSGKNRSQSDQAADLTSANGHMENDVIMAAAREMSTWSGETTSASDVTCYAYLQHGGLFIRANTVLGYCEANRQVPKQLPALVNKPDLPMVHPDAKIAAKTQTSPDSMVGAQAEVGAKCNVKRSLIGRNSKVKDNVKINNSIIMSDVTVKEGCSLNGCVICDGATIEEKCDLRDCVVGRDQTVAASNKHTNEVVNQMMEF